MLLCLVMSQTCNSYQEVAYVVWDPSRFRQGDSSDAYRVILWFDEMGKCKGLG